MGNEILGWIAVLAMALFCFAACSNVYQEDKERRKKVMVKPVRRQL